MATILESETDEPFGRFRFRGLDPKIVERWATTREQENAALRAQVAALETRAAKADAFAEEAFIEANALRETVERMEAEREEFAARQRMFRDEAAQIIRDAWAEANLVRTQTQQLADRAQAQMAAAKIDHTREIERMRAEVAAEVEQSVDAARRAMRIDLERHQARIAAETTAHQEAIDALERQCARLVAEIESCTARLLSDIAPIKEPAARAASAHGGDSPEGEAMRAADDASESLASLAAAMRGTLIELSADEPEMADAGMDAPPLGESAIVAPAG